MNSSSAPDTIAAAVAGVHGLAEVAWDRLEGAELLKAAVDLGRMKAMVDGALVAAAERLEVTDAGAAAGWASAKDLLTHVTGGRKGAGAGLVRVARHTADLPVVREALTAGQISLAQAGVIGGRVATLPRVPALRDGATGALLELACSQGFDATDLDRSFAEIVHELDPDGSVLGDDRDQDIKERGAHQARFLTLSPDTLGGVRIRGYATLEEAELVKAMLMPLAAPVVTVRGACGGDPATISARDERGRRLASGCPDPVCAHDGSDPREAGARLWDALVEACSRLAATDSLPHAHGAAVRITVTTSFDDLQDRLANRGTLPSGDSLSAAAVRRMACDAEIIPAVLGTESQVLDVGQSNRLVTSAIWLALVLRDRHCAFPGCTRLPIACDAHHIRHWADGGVTGLDNLVLLCRKHHTITHQTPWTVHLDPHTRRPVWSPPAAVDDRDRFSYHPPRRPPPLVA